jgi:hypothetical protein
VLVPVLRRPLSALAILVALAVLAAPAAAATTRACVPVDLGALAR